MPIADDLLPMQTVTQPPVLVIYDKYLTHFLLLIFGLAKIHHLNVQFFTVNLQLWLKIEIWSDCTTRAWFQLDKDSCRYSVGATSTGGGDGLQVNACLQRARLRRRSGQRLLAPSSITSSLRLTSACTELAYVVAHTHVARTLLEK